MDLVARLQTLIDAEPCVFEMGEPNRAFLGGYLDPEKGTTLWINRYKGTEGIGEYEATIL